MVWPLQASVVGLYLVQDQFCVQFLVRLTAESLQSDRRNWNRNKRLFPPCFCACFSAAFEDDSLAALWPRYRCVCSQTVSFSCAFCWTSCCFSLCVSVLTLGCFSDSSSWSFCPDALQPLDARRVVSALITFIKEEGAADGAEGAQTQNWLFKLQTNKTQEALKPKWKFSGIKVSRLKFEEVKASGGFYFLCDTEMKFSAQTALDVFRCKQKPSDIDTVHSETGCF